jgi:hypothetical protein
VRGDDDGRATLASQRRPPQKPISLRLSAWVWLWSSIWSRVSTLAGPGVLGLLQEISNA